MPSTGRLCWLGSATAIALAVAFVWLGLVVRTAPTGFDHSVIQAVDAAAVGWLRSALDFLTVVGQPLVWDTGVVVVAVLLWVRRQSWQGIQLVGWVFAAEVAATVCKILVGRVRPVGVDVSDFITQASYPSGHIVRTVVAAVLLASFLTASRAARFVAIVLVVGLSLAMGAARIVSGEHWPTDIVGGYLLSGVVLGVAVTVDDVMARRRR